MLKMKNSRGFKVICIIGVCLSILSLEGLLCIAEEINPSSKQLSEIDKLIIREEWKKASRQLFALNLTFPNNELIERRINKLAKIIKAIKYIETPDTLNNDYQQTMRRLLREKNRPTLGESLIALGILAGYGFHKLAEATSDCEISSKTGSLYITAETGGLLSNTIEKFKVSIEGKDCASGFVKPGEEEAGIRFLQNWYAEFDYIPAGKYEISIRGYNQIDEEVFVMQTIYDFPGDGAFYCTVTLDDNIMRCERRY